jgi:ABC-2 type transport system ATP-binding protein
MPTRGCYLKLAVEVKGLRKTFVSGFFRRRRKQALKGLDLSVPEGAFWGILGPNGAGKTTLLSILSNLVTPDAGEVRVLGSDLRTHSAEIFNRINLSSGNANFLWSLTVRENLEYYGMLYGLSRKSRLGKVAQLLDMFSLGEFANVRFDELSTGTKQKLSLAKALVNDPVLLFLDEPTVGLDPDAAHRIRESIRLLHRERATTVLMTTHDMREAETLCEQIAFLKEGTIKASGTPQDLKREQHLGDTISLSFRGQLQKSSLETLQGVLNVQMENCSCRILVDDHHRRLPPIIDAFVAAKVMIQDLHIEESNLEDVFMAFTR